MKIENSFGEFEFPDDNWHKEADDARRRSKIIMWFGVIILTLSALFWFATSFANAAELVTKQINFEWEYDTSLYGLAGYILYQNGEVIHTIDDPKALAVDLNVSIEPGKTEVFTMRAFDIDKEESELSQPYDLIVPTTIEGSNFLPSAMLSHSPGDVFNSIQFTAIGSTDFDGTVIGYKWDWGDGTPPVTTQSATHLFQQSGNFRVTLTVTDDKDGTGIAIVQVLVKDLLVVPRKLKVNKLQDVRPVLLPVSK